MWGWIMSVSRSIKDQRERIALKAPNRSALTPRQRYVEEWHIEQNRKNKEMLIDKDKKTKFRLTPIILALSLLTFWILLIYSTPLKEPHIAKIQETDAFSIFASILIAAISTVDFFEQHQWVIALSILFTSISVFHFIKDHLYLALALWIHSGVFLYYCSKHFGKISVVKGFSDGQAVTFFIVSPISPLVIIGVFAFFVIRAGFGKAIKQLFRIGGQ